MANAHSPEPVCPVCGAKFRDGKRLETHQRAKRHRATDLHRFEDEYARRALQTYHQDRVARSE